jgi:hypothetical protein
MTVEKSVKEKRAMPFESQRSVVSIPGSDSAPISSGASLDAEGGAESDAQAGLSSASPTPADRRAHKIRTWRRRALLKRGAKLHLAMGAKAQLYSLAMLDETGVIVSWYGGDGRNDHVAGDVVGCHHSLFYVPEEIARRKPSRDLRAAVAQGRITRKAWRRRPDGSAYMSSIVIEAVTLRDGRLQGFSHMASMVSMINVPIPAPLPAA